MHDAAPKSAANSPVPLHRVAVLLPFTRFLTDIGMPVSREFRRLRLPLAALEDPNNYVPSERFRAFVVSAARREGLESLGFEVGRANGANCADPRMREILCASPTLFHGLWTASELTNRTVSNSRVGLYRQPDSGQVVFFHRPSCPNRHDLSLQHIGWFGLMTLLGMIRVFTGPHWLPVEIGLMMNRRPDRAARAYFAGTRIRLNQPFSYISLEGVFLGQIPPPAGVRDNGTSAPNPDYLSEDFVGSVYKILRSYVEDKALSVDRVASLCLTSKRTFQRQLSAAGTSYSQLLDQVRFDAARRYLDECDMQVSEISYRLGYTDPANFSRSFGRIAGMSPQTYRLAVCPDLAHPPAISPADQPKPH